MHRYLRQICALFCLLSLSACATVSKGTYERVLFETTPPGARVVTEVETTASKSARRKDPTRAPEYFSCEPTPCEIRLHKRTNTIATVSAPGMEPLEFAITSGPSRRALAPNITGGLATGAAAGAMGVAVTTSLGASTAASIGAFAGPAGWVALSVGGSLLAVDAVTGAGQTLSPNPLHIRMVPKGTEVIPDPFVAKLRQRDEFKYKKTRLRCGDPRVMSLAQQVQCENAKRAQKQDSLILKSPDALRTPES